MRRCHEARDVIVAHTHAHQALTDGLTEHQQVISFISFHFISSIKGHERLFSRSLVKSLCRQHNQYEYLSQTMQSQSIHLSFKSFSLLSLLSFPSLPALGRLTRERGPKTPAHAPHVHLGRPPSAHTFFGGALSCSPSM